VITALWVSRDQVELCALSTAARQRVQAAAYSGRSLTSTPLDRSHSLPTSYVSAFAAVAIPLAAACVSRPGGLQLLASAEQHATFGFLTFGCRECNSQVRQQ
jgi:hypothetical protein